MTIISVVVLMVAASLSRLCTAVYPTRAIGIDLDHDIAKKHEGLNQRRDRKR